MGDGRQDVIYCRFSSDQQHEVSNKDQERRCRDHLERLGIAHGHFRVLADEILSGELDSRPALNELRELVYADRVGLVISSEMSRSSRGLNSKALLQDIVFHGGRFIAVNEGIDTMVRNWKLLAGISEIHHHQSNEDTAARVRGGQEGRVLDGDGSAGDFPYGYSSECVDKQGALNYHGRGPKPHKKVVVDEAAARVVREVFRRFAVEGHSMTAIVQWLNEVRDQVPRIGKGLWHHQHVRRILTNRKYVGEWTYGKMTTVRDSHGKKKQVKARADQRVTRVQRQHLRLVDEDLWDKAQQRLAELAEIYGMKKASGNEGPRSTTACSTPSGRWTGSFTVPRVAAA